LFALIAGKKNLPPNTTKTAPQSQGYTVIARIAAASGPTLTAPETANATTP
tara:strand:- start:713 stop:865 length:153 start_codon:yes stop_codon:yes gene_type:complete